MAVPKKRISKYRRSIRRSHHALKVVNAIICKTCGDLHRSHQLCRTCGCYKGIQIIQIKP